MREDGMIWCWRHIPVVTVGLSILVKNYRKKRWKHTTASPVLPQKTLIASTRGFEIGNLNWEKGVLWTVANMSTVGVSHDPKSPGTISGWRLHSVVN